MEQLAELWGLNADFARRLFRHEPGVVVFCNPQKGKRTYAVFLTAVPVACFVFGYLAGWIVVRRVSAHFVAHGLLVGIVATTFYLVMTSLNPQGGLPAAIAGYGTIHFWGTQILRIAGSTLGGGLHGKARA